MNQSSAPEVNEQQGAIKECTPVALRTRICRQQESSIRNKSGKGEFGQDTERNEDKELIQRHHHQTLGIPADLNCLDVLDTQEMFNKLKPMLKPWQTKGIVALQSQVGHQAEALRKHCNVCREFMDKLEH